jgi:hypothetical protein
MATLIELRRGATGIVYKVNSLIVVKCPTIEGHEDFVKENRMFDILTQHPPCPELVASFLRLDNGNFLEYMPGFSLSERLQRHQIRDPKSTRVVSIQRLEPLALRQTWMKALAEGHVGFQSVAALSEAISQQCDLRNYSSQAMSPEEFAARRTCCLELVEGGLLDTLSKAT